MNRAYGHIYPEREYLNGAKQKSTTLFRLGNIFRCLEVWNSTRCTPYTESTLGVEFEPKHVREPLHKFCILMAID
jgi:hypothetical protein